MDQDHGIEMNEYFEKRISTDRTLITTRHGTWLILDNREYGLLKKGNIEDDAQLVEKLKAEGIVLTSDNRDFVVRRFRHMFRDFDQSNFVCVVNMTERCNMGCEYCFANSGPDSANCDMNEEAMVKLIDFVNSAPWKNISFEFQGGESLLRFDLVRKFVEIAEKNLAHGKTISSYSIVSNLTLMDEDIAKFLAEKKFNVGSSLDGPKELHDSMRHFCDGTGSYDRIVSWGDRLRKMGVHVGFSPTITGESIKYGPKEIIDEYIERGMEYIYIRPVMMSGRASEKKELEVGADEFFGFYRGAIEYLLELEKKGVFMHEKKFKAMLKNIFTPYRNFMCMRRPCGACLSQMSFMPDGSIYACDSGKRMDELKVGNFVSDKYQDVVLNSLGIRAMSSEAQPLCDTCEYTAFCGTCMSRAIAYHSDIVARMPIDFDCRINRMTFDYIFGKMADDRYMRMFRRWVGASDREDACEHDSGRL